VDPNPTIAGTTSAFDAIGPQQPDLLVAFGGGSVMDTAKAVAAQMAHADSRGWLAAHLRSGEPYRSDARPPGIIAIPTTAGTGSEVTWWGTIWDERDGRKHSIAHPTLLPTDALLDATFTRSLPAALTVATAHDALSHAMESIWNRSANPVSDGLAARAIRVIPRALRAAVADGDDADAREALLGAALVAGMAMSATRTAVAHSMSYPLTSMLGVPHGIACSVTLPELLRLVGETRADRAAIITEALGAGDPGAGADLIHGLAVDVGATAEFRRHVPSVAALAEVEPRLVTPGRADNFIVPLDEAGAIDVLRRAAARAIG
jgi:alcohol dehydrogenase